MWFKFFHVSVCVQIIALLSGCHLISPFSSIGGNKEKWLFQYNFVPVHTLVGRRSPTCISLNEGQGPKGKRPHFGQQLLVQERNYLLKSLKHELHISFHKTDTQIVSLFLRKKCNLFCFMHLLPSLWLMFSTSLSNIFFICFRKRV